MCELGLLTIVWSIRSRHQSAVAHDHSPGVGTGRPGARSWVARWLAGLALTMTLASACVDAATTTKAGGDAEPRTLRAGTADNPGNPSVGQIEEFARQVEDRSHGRLRIELVPQANGQLQVDDWDQVLARQVVAGDLDLAFVPARALDIEGVTSMRALHAPFLVDNDELMDLVAADDVAEQMLAGLDDVGVARSGPRAGRIASRLRLRRTAVGPADFAGATIRSPLSATTYALSSRHSGRSPTTTLAARLSRTTEGRSPRAWWPARSWSLSQLACSRR